MYLPLLAVILLSGMVVLGIRLWSNQTQIIETTNSANLNVNQLPTNDDPLPPKRTPLGTGEPNFLSIPDRGIEAPVVFITEADEKVFQEALTRGVVHYPDTALPGEPGNPYIFGHSSDYPWKAGNYKQVFKPLIDIPVGTQVKITNDQGELFIFKVIETKIVGPKDVSVLDQYNYERTMLTLQTSYPLNTALKRYIAVCELDELATYGPATNTNGQ